jgi:AcrR family transcriptional regulator
VDGGGDDLAGTRGIDPAVRERLLDAAEMSLERYGIAKTTMENTASLAGVSRGFVYKHFKSKDGLILAMLVRRAERFNARARTFIEAQPDLTESLVQGIELAVRLADRDPYFGLLVGSATTDPVNRIEGAVQEALRLTGELWRPVLIAARERGELRAEIAIDDLVQWIMYLELILLAGRRLLGAADADQERQLREFFVPAVLADGPVIDLVARETTGRRNGGASTTIRARARRGTA